MKRLCWVVLAQRFIKPPVWHHYSSCEHLLQAVSVHYSFCEHLLQAVSVHYCSCEHLLQAVSVHYSSCKTLLQIVSVHYSFCEHLLQAVSVHYCSCEYVLQAVSVHYSSCEHLLQAVSEQYSSCEHLLPAILHRYYQTDGPWVGAKVLGARASYRMHVVQSQEGYLLSQADAILSIVWKKWDSWSQHNDILEQEPIICSRLELLDLPWLTMMVSSFIVLVKISKV